MSWQESEDDDPLEVVVAWHCDRCDVRGRSSVDAVECWNCGGDVAITAQPSVKKEK